MEKKDQARWQKISLWDFGCLTYWTAIFVSFCILFNWPIDFRVALLIQTWPRKIAALLLFWGSTIIFIQTINGFWGTFKILIKFLFSPAAAGKILIGFFWYTKKRILHFKKRLPTLKIFLLSLTLVVLLGLSEENRFALKALEPLCWLMIVWVIYSCFSWTLDPLPFLEKSRNLRKVITARSKAVEGLATVKAKDLDSGHKELLKKLSSFKLFILAFPKIMNFLRGPQLLFLAFSGIFVFGALSVLLLTSSILRIEHLLTPGGAFSGTFFRNEFQDYFLISLNHFVSAEMYNINVISPGIRYVLSLLPVVSLTLTLLLVLAFTMVGQSTVDTTFKNFGDDILKTIDEATKRISEKREIVLIDQKKSDRPDLNREKYGSSKSVAGNSNTKKSLEKNV